MQTLIVIPTEPEIALFLDACHDQGIRVEKKAVGKMMVHHLPDKEMSLASGGLGKAQFGVQTQHLIDENRWALVVCAGAAGALDDRLQIGDVVIATETVEHDIYNRIGPPILPRFTTSRALLAYCRKVMQPGKEWRIHYGPIASGDEDVVDSQRRLAVQQLTGAIAVAWEGAGGARAAQFNGVPYVEIRCLTDAANEEATQDYRANLRQAMEHLTQVVFALSGFPEKG